MITLSKLQTWETSYQGKLSLRGPMLPTCQVSGTVLELSGGCAPPHPILPTSHVSGKVLELSLLRGCCSGGTGQGGAGQGGVHRAPPHPMLPTCHEVLCDEWAEHYGVLGGRIMSSWPATKHQSAKCNRSCAAPPIF